MGQTCQDDTRTRPREPGLTTRMVERGIQQQDRDKTSVKIESKRVWGVRFV